MSTGNILLGTEKKGPARPTSGGGGEVRGPPTGKNFLRRSVPKWNMTFFNMIFKLILLQKTPKMAKNEHFGKFGVKKNQCFVLVSGKKSTR